MASDDVPTREQTPRWVHGTADARGSTIAAEGGPDARPSGELLSNARYRVGGEIGRGGMGRVVAATDLALERPVAIKQVLVDDDEHIARFEREARITAKLAHPAVVPVFDIGRDPEGRPFYVMRKIEGTPLDDKIASAVTARDRLSLLPSVLAAVDAAASAHAQQIVHRDIKPANILLGPYGETLLIDWGLARDGIADSVLGRPVVPPTGADEGLTRAGHAYGTIGYMAPEQARGEPADARADVYALGATIFHVVTGTRPSGKLAATAWLALMIDDPQPLRITDDAVPAELSAIVTKATMPERDDRYANASELARDLRRFLGGQLVAAHRYTTRQRLARFVRRHKVAVAAITVAVITVTVITATAITGIVRARDDAEAAQRVAERESEERALRSDQLLLEQAQRFAETEPEHALAVIAQIRPGSPTWPAARDVLADAAAHGIAHGMDVLHGIVTPQGFAPDGHRVLVSSSMGELAVVDLAHREVTRLVESDMTMYEAVWNGGEVIVSNQDGIVAFDPVTAKKRLVTKDAPISPLFPTDNPEHIRYTHLPTAELRDLDLATGVSTTIAAGLTAVVADGGAAAYLTPELVNLVPALGAPPVTVARLPDHPITNLAVSASARRAAGAYADVIVEWNLDTGEEVRRIPLPSNTRDPRLFYTRGTLMVDLRTVAQRELHIAGTWDIFDVAGPWTDRWHGDTARGGVFVTDAGALAIYRTGTNVNHLTGRRGQHGLATDPRSSLVAVGSSDGVLYWWDVATVLPQDVDTGEPDASPCFVDRNKVVFASSAHGIASVDLATGDKAIVAKVHADNGCFRDRPLGGRLPFRGAFQPWSFLELATGKTIPGAQFIVPDYDHDAWLAVRDDAVYHSEQGPPIDRPFWKLPAPIHAIATRGDDLVAGLADGRVARRDAAGAERVAAVGKDPIAATSIDDTHVAWIALGRDVYRWPLADDAPTKALSFGLPVTDLSMGFGAGILAARLQDGSLWLARDGQPPERLPSEGRAGFVQSTTDDIVESTGTLIRRTHIGSGLSTVQQVDSNSWSLMLPDAHTMIVSTATEPSHLLVFRDTVPDDQKSAQVWIGEQTNFAVDPVTLKAGWR